MKFHRLLYVAVLLLMGLQAANAHEDPLRCNSPASTPPQKVLHLYICHTDLLWNVLLIRADAYTFQYDEALQRLQSLQLRHRQQPVIYTLRGEVHLLLYEWDKALADFNRAIVLDRKYAPAYFQRGVLWATLGKSDAAYVDFSRYLALHPDGPYVQAATRYRDQLENRITPPGT